MDTKDLEILNLFNRYLDWIKNNNLQDNIDNYRTYFKYIENIPFIYGNWEQLNIEYIVKLITVNDIIILKLNCTKN